MNNISSCIRLDVTPTHLKNKVCTKPTFKATHFISKA